MANLTPFVLYIGETMSSKLDSLIGTIWIGLCPVCPTSPEMALNTSDVWECPECKLLIIAAGEVVVMPNVGSGNFVSPKVFAIDCYGPRHDTRIKQDGRKF